MRDENIDPALGGAAAAPDSKKLRILLVHNYYQSRGGEDAVVEAELDLLRGHGHEVRTYFRSNADIDRQPYAATAVQTLWSSRSRREVRALLRDFAPHVMHVHNSFPLISPSVYGAAAEAGVAVVQTLHNFRLLCPQAMFLREDRVCEDCLGHLPWRAVAHACYRGSRLQSAAVAGMLTLHRAMGTWQTKVHRYIALNEFCRQKFISAGWPAQKIAVKPNFVDFPPPGDAPRSGFLFVGRLSPEKGIHTLATASAAFPAAEVLVAGAGPEADRLRAMAPSAKLLGALDASAVQAQMARATALVMPSIWYENFPRTLVEAFASGLPVIASRLGALQDLVEDGVTGLHFEPGNAGDLAKCMKWAASHPAAMADMGRRARIRYEAEYSAQPNYARMITIYRQALQLTSPQST